MQNFTECQHFLFLCRFDDSVGRFADNDALHRVKSELLKGHKKKKKKRTEKTENEQQEKKRKNPYFSNKEDFASREEERRRNERH